LDVGDFWEKFGKDFFGEVADLDGFEAFAETDLRCRGLEEFLEIGGKGEGDFAAGGAGEFMHSYLGEGFFAIALGGFTDLGTSYYLQNFEWCLEIKMVALVYSIFFPFSLAT